MPEFSSLFLSRANKVSQSLPIHAVLSDIKIQFLNHPNLILQAEPGAGKTSIVPLFLLSELPKNKKIIVLEPRRLAARNAAQRMAEILGEKLGQRVGFRVRGESKVSHATQIEVVTEGILTRMIQSDPELLEVSMIIFDEFHERSLHADLGLAFALEVQQTLREDLKILLMSATLDTTRLSNLLDRAPVIFCPGKSFPVDIHYLPSKTNFDWLQGLVAAVGNYLESIQFPQLQENPINGKDILIFLPGVFEINKAKKILSEIYASCLNLQIVTLYGDMSFESQRQALLPIKDRCKIILATNIAETSLTIQGVGCVVDSGLMRQSTFDPNLGFDRLTSIKISKASATQRAGRAGRTEAGVCYRLWSESDSLKAENTPQLMIQDLAGFCLELALWGHKTPATLKLLDQPNPGMIAQAQALLMELQAIDENMKLTSHGVQLAQLGLHPRIGHMLIKSVEQGLADLGCLLAAILEERDVLSGEQKNNPDFHYRVSVFLSEKSTNGKMRRIQQQSKALLSKLQSLIDGNRISQKKIADTTDKVGLLLAFAFPDRVAKQRGNGYQMVSGTGVQANQELYFNTEFLVIVRLGGRSNTAKIFQAAELSRCDLESAFADRLKTSEQIDWDPQSQSVKGVRQVKLGELLIDSQPVQKMSDEQRIDGLLKGILQLGLEKLPWPNATRQWLAKIQMLRKQCQYETEFPDLSFAHLTATIQGWLLPFLGGISKISQLTPELLTQAVKSNLGWTLQQKLEELMPTNLKVASGSQVPLDYLQNEKPVLAVKLQEMFGVKTTPKIAEDSIGVVVHLLSPAKRPLQITEDLASFWENSYQAVKKEMKGRYPKHPWPDDPLQAVATKLTKKKLKQSN